jgi:type I restriction enzyme specificity protein hsdS
MSKLDDLIKELCPDGVEYKELKEVLVIKNGSDYKKYGKGDVPVYGSGGIMTYIDKYVYEKPTVLIPRKGSLDKLYYLETPFWNVDTIYYTIIDTNVALPKYVYHCLLREHLEKLNTAGGVPSLTQTVLNRVKIPVPPPEIQREIVHILDNFTALTAELTAELTARKQQYEYYRDSLLSFGENQVEWVKIESICSIQRGRVMSKEYIAENKGSYPVYSSQTENNGELGSISSFDFDGEYLTWTTDGANAGTVFYRDGKFSVTNVCGILEVKPDVLLTKYLYYALSIEASKYVNNGMGNPKLMSNVMARIKIPFPSLKKQQEIVTILDQFNELTNDIIFGLPAEISARQQQYEYYRDKLLTFKEK